SSAEPIRDNPLVVSVADGSPAAWAGLGYGDQIISVNGVAIGDGQYSNFAAPDPGTNATVSFYRGGDLLQANVISGVVFTTIADDLPADNAGLRNGMILTSLNGSIIRNEADFRNILTSLAPGSTVPVSALIYNSVSGS